MSFLRQNLIMYTRLSLNSELSSYPSMLSTVIIGENHNFQLSEVSNFSFCFLLFEVILNKDYVYFQISAISEHRRLKQEDNKQGQYGLCYIE